MKAIEFGHVLSIDQASNLAGVSLWHNGDLKATTVLKSRSPDDPFSRRLQYQVPQLTQFIDLHVPPQFLVEKVVFEAVRPRLIMATVGAFLTSPRISARMAEKTSFIESSVWKKWAKDHGATGIFKEIKGVKSLREAGFDVDKYGISSDDVADSIMQYKAWVRRG